MTHNKLFIVIGIIFLTGLNAHDSFSERSVLPVIKTELGAGGVYFNYEEPGLMKEKGAMAGVHGSFTAHVPPGQIMLRTEAEYLGGQLTYDGSYSDGTPLTAKSNDFLVSLRGMVGRDFIYDNYAVTPFIGIGWRYWNDKVQDSGGYERRIQYIYSPIGVRWEIVPDDSWRFGFVAEYDFLWQGNVKSFLSDVGSAYSDIENKQQMASGYGIRFSNYYEILLTSWSVKLEPFIRYWSFRDSESTLSYVEGEGTLEFYEPENSTFTAGLEISAGF